MFLPSYPQQNKKLLDVCASKHGNFLMLITRVGIVFCVSSLKNGALLIITFYTGSNICGATRGK